MEIGQINNFYMAQSVAVPNGGGTVAINAPQSGLNGNTVINSGGILTIGDNNALWQVARWSSMAARSNPTRPGIPLLLAPRTITNGILMTGDASFAGGANVDLVLGGNIALSNSTMGGGVLRNFTTNATANTNLVILSGVISDGAGVTNDQINKAGAGILVLTNSNTYTGYTNVSAGELVFSSDRANLGSNTGLNQTVILSGGTLGLWNASNGVLTTNRNYDLTAASNLDVAAGQTLIEGNGDITG